MSDFLSMVLAAMVAGVIVIMFFVLTDTRNRERAECEAIPGHVLVIQRSGPNLCVPGRAMER